MQRFGAFSGADEGAHQCWVHRRLRHTEAMPAQEFGRTMPFCMAIVPILHRECCLAWPGYDAFICMTSEAGTDVPSQIGHPGISGEFVEMAPTAAGKIPCWPKYKPPTPPQKMSSSQVTVASVSLPSFVSHRGLLNTNLPLSPTFISLITQCVG